MPKHNQYQVERPRDDKNKKVHPIWRGIGCVLSVIIPFFSYLTAVQLLNQHDKLPWVIIPPEIVLNTSKDPLILVKILYGLIITLLLFALLGIVTFAVNRFFGPSTRGPYDVRD